jgi:hypothetical protein
MLSSGTMKTRVGKHSRLCKRPMPNLAIGRIAILGLHFGWLRSSVKEPRLPALRLIGMPKLNSHRPRLPSLVTRKGVRVLSRTICLPRSCRTDRFSVRLKRRLFVRDMHFAGGGGAAVVKDGDGARRRSYEISLPRRNKPDRKAPSD